MKFARWWLALTLLLGSLNAQAVSPQQRLAAGKQRLAARQQRLAARQQRLAAKQQRLAELLAQLRIENGHILFPSIYHSFQKQLGLGAAGDSSKQLSPELQDQLRVELEAWVRISREVSGFLAAVLEVRGEAVALQAEEFAADVFQEAEKQLQDAARAYHQNQRKKARQLSERARQLYLQAQAEAIRNRLLGEARIFIQESKDMGAENYAPRTLALVETLLADVERLVNSGRYDDPNLTRRSQLLEEQARHLLSLMQVIRSFHRDKAAAEAYLLELEGGLDSLAALVNYRPRYSQGLPQVIDELSDALHSFKNELDQLREENRRLREENQALRQQVARLEKQLGRKRSLASRIQRIGEMLAPRDISVRQEGDWLVLGIDNVPFAPGSSAIPPEAEAALQAIVHALAEFAGQKVQVVVSLLGKGNPAYNQNLAQQRARALAHYFQSQLPIPDRLIETLGEARNSAGSNSRGLNRVAVKIQLPGR
ncbi:MAG: hypothetical protein D6715_14115 [Calditrichaeota bacterium]|nr:MAG: hypothetical protein D6715_14115 [Calditrichota bacterium]